MLHLSSTTDDTLPWVDYSTLTAVNMCPRWGIIHSYMGKRPANNAAQRSMALDAGSAMHDVFAAVRMFELVRMSEGNTAVEVKLQRLFGDDRAAELLRITATGDYKTSMTQAALMIVETSGFYDDLRDKKRTLSNLCDATIQYVSKYPTQRFIPISVGDDFGVEIPFDITVTSDCGMQPFRFLGKIDAVCADQLRNNMIGVHENKTGSRIDTVWSDSFTINHQVTGYILAVNTILRGIFVERSAVNSAVIWGLQIPIPSRSIYGDGTARVQVYRNMNDFVNWEKWITTTWKLIQEYKDDPADAPMYTHSCSRYFQSCSFIPFCALSYQDRVDALRDEMVEERWNPTEG